MFDDGFPAPPPLPDGPPIGPNEQLAVFVLLCFLFVVGAYLFFDLCAELMSREFWGDWKKLQARRSGKRWWEF